MDGKGAAGTILLSTSYGERRNVVVCLSLAGLSGQAGLQYFSQALAERHEEAAEALDFYIRLPAPGSITGVAEIRVDSVADLKSLKCVQRVAPAGAQAAPYAPPPAPLLAAARNSASDPSPPLHPPPLP